MARVKFAPYALLQMQERNLSEAAVRDAVEKPEQVLSAKGHRKIAHKRLKRDDREYLLRVIYEEVAGEATVITAYRTSKVQKYWRQE